MYPDAVKKSKNIYNPCHWESLIGKTKFTYMKWKIAIETYKSDKWHCIGTGLMHNIYFQTTLMQFIRRKTRVRWVESPKSNQCIFIDQSVVDNKGKYKYCIWYSESLKSSQGDKTQIFWESWEPIRKHRRNIIKTKKQTTTTKTIKELPGCFQHLICKILWHLLPSGWSLLCLGLTCCSC